MSTSEYWQEEVTAPCENTIFQWRRIWKRITSHYYFHVEIRQYKNGYEKDGYPYQLLIMGAFSNLKKSISEWRNPWRERDAFTDPFYIGKRYKESFDYNGWDPIEPDENHSTLTRHGKTIAEVSFYAKKWMDTLENDFYHHNGISLVELRTEYEEKRLCLSGISHADTWSDLYKIAKEYEAQVEKMGFTKIFCSFVRLTDGTKRKEEFLYPKGKGDWTIESKRFKEITDRKKFEEMIVSIFETFD